MNRPDWNKVMADCGGANPDDNGLVIVTRGTARLALSTLRAQNAAEYYHNYGAAEVEIAAALDRPAPTAEQSLGRLNAGLAECDSDCASKTGVECSCGAWIFRPRAVSAGESK